MMFILRTIFWLTVVSAIMPARDSGEPGLGESAGRAVGAAMDYCATKPGECMQTAQATAAAIRIPAEFVMRAQASTASSAPSPVAPNIRALVPQPQPRPATL